ncbi:MAG TPA: tyrosine-protein phosphatase, partial [Thermomicrobiaceae bacterium]|nr:tyrosine-protein phosphatase [Thermomicrobiaceae bacterium]
MNTDEDSRRRLTWEGLTNAPDLGGYRNPTGFQTRWGALVRSERLAELTSQGRAALREYGIRTVIDLRTTAECAAEPSPFAAGALDTMRYQQISVIDPDHMAASEASALPLGDGYKLLL